uniref:HD2 n=2 Tax=Glomus cerebriforme TaxID=658196 RepID=A0A142BM10_9GLOM|nr:HD2 AMF mating type protein [Glomus cerebriforme]AMP19731.1 HD2 [Glomus cerebriforme]
MEFLKDDVRTLREIRIELSKFSHYSSNKVVNLPIRKLFFEQYYKSNYNDETQFINLFQNQVSTKIAEPNIDNTLFESLCDDNYKDLRIKVYNMYCEEIEKVRAVSEKRRREQKLTLLRSYFILPTSGSKHVQEILAKIDRTFSFVISKVIRDFQNIVLHRFTELHIIRRPIKVDTGSRFTDSIKQILEAFYGKNNRPNNNEKKELSHQTELTMKQIETWFNNRRNREEKDLQELEARTKKFIGEEMDWEEMFNAIESGKETSKDMIVITTTALELSDEEKEAINKPIEEFNINSFNNNGDETTPSSQNSLVIRSRVTRGAHKSKAAPYTKQTPMVTKITMMRSKIEAGTSSESAIQISSKDSQENISTVQCSSYQHSDSENSKIVTSNKLKIRYRPNKNSARTRAQPYARTQNADKEKDNNEVSNITPVSQECFDLLRSIQSNVEPIAVANNMETITTYDVDELGFDYTSIFTPTTEYMQNLSNEFCSNTNGYDSFSSSLSSSISSLTDYSQNHFDFTTDLTITNNLFNNIDNTNYSTPNMNSLYDVSFQNDFLNSNNNIYSTGWTNSDNFNYYPENDDNFIQNFIRDNFIDPRSTFNSNENESN